MALCKSTSGARLEIALEPSSGLLVGAFDGNNETPGSMIDRVAGTRGVVQNKAAGDVVGETRVMVGRVRFAANDVHEALVVRHGWMRHIIRAERGLWAL